MKSPFPGMDPYLERHFHSVQWRLNTYIRDELNGSLLPEELRADVRERVFVDEAIEEAWGQVVAGEVTRGRDDKSGGKSGERGAEGAVELRGQYVNDPIREHSVLITDRDERVVTVIEVLGPCIKLPGKAREQYLAQRREDLRSGANLVEIDLYRAGDRTDDRLMRQFGPTKQYYLIVMVYAVRPDACAAYTFSIRDRIPSPHIPLRKQDAEVEFHLQPLVDRIYVNGRYPIDYSRELDPPLFAEDTEWAEARLREAGVRK